MTDVEIRCPQGPFGRQGKFFFKLKLDGVAPRVVDGNLLEVKCADCRKGHSDPTVVAVFHRFNMLGDLVETEIVRPVDSRS